MSSPLLGVRLQDGEDDVLLARTGKVLETQLTRPVSTSSDAGRFFRSVRFIAFLLDLELVGGYDFQTAVVVRHYVILIDCDACAGDYRRCPCLI